MFENYNLQQLVDILSNITREKNEKIKSIEVQYLSQINLIKNRIAKLQYEKKKPRK